MLIQCKHLQLHEGFHSGLESLTYLHHMVYIDIGHYSNNGGFQGICCNIGQQHLTWGFRSGELGCQMLVMIGLCRMVTIQSWVTSAL